MIYASIVNGIPGGADKPPEEPSTSTAHSQKETSEDTSHGPEIVKNCVYFTNCSNVQNIMGAKVVNVASPTSSTQPPRQTDHYEIPIKTDIVPSQSEVSEEIKNAVMELVGNYHQPDKWAENQELCMKLFGLFQNYNGKLNHANTGSVWLFVHFISVIDLKKLWEDYRCSKLAAELSDILICQELQEKAPCDLKVVVTIEEDHFQTGCDYLEQQEQSETTESIGTWVLDGEFGNQGPGKLFDARGITINRINGDIAVADSIKASVNIFNKDGEHKFNLNTKQGLKPGARSCPHWVTTSSDGTYYITDRTQFVKMFGKDGAFKGQMAAVSPENHPSDAEPTNVLGLTTDANDQLYVGEITQRYVSIHSSDGSHINSIRVGIQPIHLELTSKDTIIINSSIEGTSQIVDKTGQLLHTLKPSEDLSWVPTGVCCYGNIIFICNLSKEEIFCFSVSDGKFLGSIPTQVARSRGIALVEDGQKLLVSGRKAVHIFSCQK